MQEKIYEEFNKPDYVKVSVEQYQDMKEEIDRLKITLSALKEEIKELNNIIEEFENDI